MSGYAVVVSYANENRVSIIAELNFGRLDLCPIWLNFGHPDLS